MSGFKPLPSFVQEYMMDNPIAFILDAYRAGAITKPTAIEALRDYNRAIVSLCYEPGEI